MKLWIILGAVVAMGVGGVAPGEDVAVVRTFEGNRGPGHKAGADLSGAVGPKHVIELTDGGFAVHSKATGQILQTMTPREFWNQVDAGQQAEKGTGFDPQKECNDPKVLYDPLTDRWFAVEAGTGPETKVYMAVTATGDPTGTWKGAILPVPPRDPGVKIGVDRNGFYVCAYNGDKDFQQGMNCYAIPKADAVAAGGPDLSHLNVLGKMQYPAAAMVDLDPHKAPDAPFVMLNFDCYTGASTDEIYLYKLTWRGTQASVSAKQIIKLSRRYLTPNAQAHLMDCPQPSGVKLRADGGRRTENLVAYQGRVFGCNSAKLTKEGRTGILWYEIRVSDGQVMQEGFVEDANRDYLYPALAVDGNGNIAIGCTGTSETEFPSVYVMMHAAEDAAGTMRPAVCAVEGTTSYRYAGLQAANWTNYSSACLDPSDAGLIWTYQGFAASEVNRQWCSAWAAFRLAASGNQKGPEKGQ